MATRLKQDAEREDVRLLRILSGAHLGAEMPLHPGRYLIGTDQDCDIVLSDRGLAPHHAYLTLSDGLTSIEPADGMVVVEGESLDGRTAVDEFSPVLLGTVALALGPTDASWPEIEVPKLEVRQPADRGDGEADEDAAPAEHSPSAREGVAVVPPAAAAASDAEARGGSRLRSWALVAAAVVILVAAAAAAFGFYLVRPATLDTAQPAAAADPPASLAQIKAIVDKLGLGSVLQVAASKKVGDDDVVVEGYVDTETQRRAVLSALQPYLEHLEIDVWSTELLDASVKQALDGMRVELNVAPVSDGKVVLSGVLPGALSADQLREALHRDVPGLASIVLNVVSTSEATHWLHDQMAANGIDASEVSITHDDTSLIATGELAASVRGPWHDLAAEFVKRYGEQLTLQDKVTFTAAPENPVVQFNLVVRAVSIGPPAYITLDTGEKYLVGSRLSNGMVLEKIMPDGMVLRDGETRHLVEIAPDSGRVTRAGKVESK